MRDQCKDDGDCDPVYDSCICPDCDSYCSEPADGKCTGDGTCDSFVEGCNCTDCSTVDDCGAGGGGA